MLDPALGRWWQVDPLANQLVWQTPYNSRDNNPIRYNDPEGDYPSCAWGAVVGGGTEYLSQVVSNVITSPEGLNAVTNLATYTTNIDWYLVNTAYWRLAISFHIPAMYCRCTSLFHYTQATILTSSWL